MYFIQYDPLKHKLSTRSLSDGEVLPYLILEALVLTLLTIAPSEGITNAYGFVSMCLSVIIVIGGTYYVYAQNGGKEGFDLVQKYTVLSWVVGIRCFLAFIPVMIVYVVVLVNLGGTDTNMLHVLFVAIAQIIYYQRLGRHIRDTKGFATVD